MTNKKAVVFDLDDTLINFCETFCRWMQKTHQLPEDNPPYDEYDLMAPFHANLKDPDTIFWLRKFEDAGAVDDVNRTPLIDIFKSYIDSPDHRVIIMTARGWMKEPEGSVYRLMDRFDIPRDKYEVLITTHGESKAAMYARTIDNELECVYDDVIANLETFHARYPKAKLYCPARPWNVSSAKHIQRIAIGDLFSSQR